MSEEVKEKRLMPYEEIRRTFRESRQKVIANQGPITDEMIQTLQNSRKYVQHEQSKDSSKASDSDR